MACLVPALLCARGEVTLTGLRSLDDNAGGWTIERVVLSDTATVGDFSVEDKPYSWFTMTSGAYLSDEKARRYALKGAVGLVLDERFRMPKSGKAEFRLIFEPIPAIRKAKKAIRKAFENSMAGKGSNLVEIVSTCNSGWKMSPEKSNKWMQEHMFPFYPLGDLKDKQ